MAKVLDIQEITLPSTLNNDITSGYYYNGYYYINTYNKIYKYDYINNVLTTLYNKSTDSYYCLGINDNIYSFYYNQPARQEDNYVFNIIEYTCINIKSISKCLSQNLVWGNFVYFICFNFHIIKII